MKTAPTRQFNIRLPHQVRSALTRAAGRRGIPSSAVAIQALTEWTRTQEHPGIDFRWTPTGRLPHVVGTGLSVWEFLHLWKDHGENLESLLRNFPHLTRTQIQAAVTYAKVYAQDRPEDAFGTRPAFAREVKV